MRHLLLSFLLSGMLATSAVAYSPGQYIDNMWIDEGEKLVALTPDMGKEMLIKGWTRRGRGEVYRVRVKAGDRLRIEIDSPSPYLLLAVFDFATPDAEAIFFSEPDNRKTVLTIQKDTELLVRPILILGQPRRGLGVNYQLTFERKGL